MDFVKIPEERLGVLIGTNGKVKKEIEKRSKVNLEIDGTSVSVDGEGLAAWKACDVVNAIGRGFSPEYAFLIFNEDHVFETLNLKDYGTEKSWNRLRGRVIGQDGKIKKFIEQASGASLCIYGKTVSFIGKYDDVTLAREVVSMILSGSRYGSVRRFLEQQNKKRFNAK